jgi:adenylate cyclase
MAKDRLSGKLAVILHADIADSTALVQQDKRLAHERIQDTFKRFSDIIEKYQGHVVELRGDALLAEFERASDAVSAALSFQSDHADHNSRINDGLRPTVRVGIAMGEVIIADSTVTGAGVVQAQRVEQLADSGGICITAAICESLSKLMPFDLEDLGEQVLKGFDIPVRVYRAELIAGQSIPPPQQTSLSETPSTKPRLVVAIIVIVFLVAGGAAYWFKTQEPKVEAASIERMAFPLPDKPSIAVLPFTNMSSVAEQEYFADGMTENLITDLSKISGLFVIARNSSFSYKGQQVKIRQVAEELGVRYVLEGSVQRAGEQVRINAQLIDATTGGHLWAERYDGSLQDIFTLQDQVTQQIVIALKVSLTGEEEAQYLRHNTENVEAHDAFLQGWANYKLGTTVDLARSIPLFEEAVRLDSGYAEAHAALATVYWDAYQKDWAFDLGIPSFEAESRASLHLDEALKTPNPLAHAQMSRVYLALGFPGEAVRESELAVAIDSNNASGYASLANALILTDRPQEGADMIRKAMRLDPHHPPEYLTILGAAQFGLEQYEAAARTLERAVNRIPDSEKPLIYLASSYGHLGNMRDAEDTIETTNDLRATLGLGQLSLEKEHEAADYSPFRGEIDFPSFGLKQAQDRLRLGLSKIPALNWQYLIRVHLVIGEGNSWFEVEGATEIDLATAKSFYDRGVMFIDVGTDREGHWQKGRVAGAVNLPLRENNPGGISLRETELNKILDKSEEVVFYWCTRDTTVCNPYYETAKAVTWGYQKVFYFIGGAPAWKEAGYPIEADD